MPVTIIEGTRESGREGRAQTDRVRFVALVAAVREHEERTRRGPRPNRPRDDRLYRRVREICSEPGSSHRWIS
ncbi:MAG: hypothetical protein R2718_10980 [Solirubrobacterales bacterium]|nr:hypothetical protein [Solirubrobacterales bacterium]